MREFNILLKKELKEHFFSHGKGEKRDILSTIFTIVLMLIVIVGLVYISLAIAKSYVDLSFHGETSRILRSKELLNFIYLIFSMFLLFYILEKERKIMVDIKDKAIILRLPLKSSTIFLSKFVVTYLLALFASAIIIIPVNIIFYVAINNFNVLFIFGTIFNILFFPVVPFLLATILLVPYIKVLNFFKDRQLLTLIVYVALLTGGFYLYSSLLNVFRTLLETGNIRFLFKTDNIAILNNLANYAYPLNFLVDIALGINSLIAYLVIVGVVIVAFIGSIILAKVLFNHTLYTSTGHVDRVYKTKLKARKPFVSLLRKEFLLTYRDNGNLFSYFAIALAMPLMVFASYTLFRDLLYNAIGLRIDFVLGLLLLFVFVVLTNTYSSTNISREGLAFLKSKAFPYSAKKIFLAKVVFAFVISSIVSIVASIIIICFSNMTPLEGTVLILAGIMFSLSQILLGTKMDLNKANLTLNNYEIAKKQEKTISKLVFTGLLIAIILCVSLILIDTLLPIVLATNIVNILVVIFALVTSIIYLVITIFFYLYKLEDRFVNLVL